MNISRIAVPLLIVFAMLSFQGCSASSTETSMEPTAQETSALSSSTTLLNLTLDELKEYNGQNGNLAYIAVGGIIYDVTNIPQWKNGTHHGFSAGQDVTSAIKSSPHGISKLDGVPLVGNLVS